MAWQKVASLDALRDGEVIGVEVGATTVALYRLGDEVRATSGICTHALALLADGFVESADGTIECPLHQALFDIRTGKALSGPATEDLAVYPVKVDGGDVLIDLQMAGQGSVTTVAPTRDAAPIAS